MKRSLTCPLFNQAIPRGHLWTQNAWSSCLYRKTKDIFRYGWAGMFYFLPPFRKERTHDWHWLYKNDKKIALHVTDPWSENCISCQFSLGSTAFYLNPIFRLQVQTADCSFWYWSYFITFLRQIVTCLATIESTVIHNEEVIEYLNSLSHITALEWH